MVKICLYGENGHLDFVIVPHNVDLAFPARTAETANYKLSQGLF